MTIKLEKRIEAANIAVTMERANLAAAKIAERHASRLLQTLRNEKTRIRETEKRIARKKREAEQLKKRQERQAAFKLRREKAEAIRLELERKREAAVANTVKILKNKFPGAVDLPGYGPIQEKGAAIYAFKYVQVKTNGSAKGGAVIMLKIPTQANRIRTSWGGKARSSAALVMGVVFSNVTIKATDKLISGYDRNFEYKIGEVARPTRRFDSDRSNSCGTGIHFWATVREARSWGNI